MIEYDKKKENFDEVSGDVGLFGMVIHRMINPNKDNREGKEAALLPNNERLKYSLDHQVLCDLTAMVGVMKKNKKDPNEQPEVVPTATETTQGKVEKQTTEGVVQIKSSGTSKAFSAS